MANEILKVDQNGKPVAGFVTDDSNQEIRMGRIDDTTKGLKVMIVGGTGAGTVTSVAAGTGLSASPSPITGAGTISLANTAVTPGSYTNASITVDAQGRITSASSGSAGTGTVTSVSVTTANGVSGSVATATTTPAITLTLGAITPTSVNGLTISTTTGTLTVTNGKTLTVSNTLTLAGTDGTVMTFPTTSATIARTDAANTFTGAQTFNTAIVVSSGGTGVSSNTAYAVLCGGTTSTNPIQSIASVGTSGQVLTSNGAGALPTFQNAVADAFAVTSKPTTYMNLTIPLTSSASSADGGAPVGWTTSGCDTSSGYFRGSYGLFLSNSTTAYMSTLLPGAPGGSLDNYRYSDTKKLVVSFRFMLAGSGNRSWGLGSGTTAAWYTPSSTAAKTARFTWDGTNLKACNNNASTLTETTITGITTTNWNTYRIEIDPASAIRFYVNGVLKATHTTNLPSGATDVYIGTGVDTSARNNYMTAPIISLEE